MRLPEKILFGIEEIFSFALMALCAALALYNVAEFIVGPGPMILLNKFLYWIGLIEAPVPHMG
jgi:hypothetical protein